MRSGPGLVKAGDVVDLSLRFGEGQGMPWKVSARVVHRDADGVGLTYTVCEGGFVDFVQSMTRKEGPGNAGVGSAGVPHRVEGERATLKLRGRLDFSFTQTFWRLCSGSAHRVYLVDLSRVTEICDSGMALLMMLARHARRRRALFGFINGPGDHRHDRELHRVLQAMLAPDGALVGQEAPNPPVHTTALSLYEQHASAKGRSAMAPRAYTTEKSGGP